jgi:hypothetical protein
MGLPIISPKVQFFDLNGVPLAGGKLLTKVVGGGADKVTYSDADLTTQNTNPVILNARGEASVFAASGEVFWLRLTDSADVTIWTVDKVEIPNIFANDGDLRKYGAVGDGVANVSSALSSAISANDAILPSGTWLINTNVTLPSGVLRIQKGAVLKIRNDAVVDATSVIIIADKDQEWIDAGGDYKAVGDGTFVFDSFDGSIPIDGGRIAFKPSQTPTGICPVPSRPTTRQGISGMRGTRCGTATSSRSRRAMRLLSLHLASLAGTPTRHP